jgi:hypothetical protein
MSAPVYPATGRTWTEVRVSAAMVTNRPFLENGTRRMGMAKLAVPAEFHHWMQ